MSPISRASIAAAVLTYALAASVLPGAAQQTPDWPQFGRDNGHSFYSANRKVNASNAANLGVKWMANLFSADLGSPVVAYNAPLAKTVVYVGNNRADVIAVDASTGKTLWATNVGLNDKMQATPVIAPDGSVWVATSYNATLYKLDGATGTVLCSAKSPSGLPINGSPMIATPPGGVTSVYWDTIDAGKRAGPTVATNESNCKTLFSFSKYLSLAGAWVTPAYSVDTSGRPLIFIGTADTDAAEYAIDAVTGALVWDHLVLNPPPGTYDIGDASTISAPGKAGFADGVVYVDTKYGIEYAFNLATGAQIWQSTIADSRSSAALDPNNHLVMGTQSGVFNLNATTGKQIWEYATPAEVLSSPALIGPSGSEIAAFGDLTGAFRVLGVSSGSQLYSYQTGGYITASVAEANGQLFVSSSDGFLYAYGIGGANSTPPATTITSPVDLSRIPNPNGNISITGTSTDPTGVNAVEIAIQTNGTSGPWYNAAAGTYVNAPVRNAATLAKPGATSTTWTIPLPAPAAGGTFTAFANSVNAGNIVGRGATSYFTILSSNGEPHIMLTTAFVPPGGSFGASSTAFKPGEKVTFTLFGAIVGTSTANSKGFVPRIKIKVPLTATFGPTSLTVTGASSGKRTTATVGITNNWTQLGHDAAREAFEPNDPVIKDTISVGPNGTVLSRAWDYLTGAAVNTSPAVVNGIVYAGNDAGVMSAIVTNTGAPVWTYTTPSRAPIHSSPAVNEDGSIIFGADDGNLYTLSSKGTLTRTVSLGGKLTSAAVDSGDIFIASDSGKLYDVADRNDTIKWAAKLPAAVHSSPSYDTAKDTVIVGDDSGAITAFNSNTGAQRWKFSTGGAVTASPLIYDGSVYVGSGDSNFYALNETTGTIVWKTTLDAPVIAGAATYLAGVNSISISVGDTNGTVYRFSTDGLKIYTFDGANFNHAAVVGVAGVLGNTFVETSGGMVGMLRMNDTTPLLLWVTQTKAGLSTTPAIVDGAVYIGAGDGGLYAFTPHGVSPVPAARKGPIVTITNAWTCTTTKQ